MSIEVDRVASGINLPTFAASPPGKPNELFITEKDTGRVLVLDLSTNQISPQPFFQIPASEMSHAGEGGLLGLAFHPDYATNGKVYLSFTNEAGDSELWEGTRCRTNPSTADATSSRAGITIARPAANHLGGWSRFGAG